VRVQQHDQVIALITVGEQHLAGLDPMLAAVAPQGGQLPLVQDRGATARRRPRADLRDWLSVQLGYLRSTRAMGPAWSMSMPVTSVPGGRSGGRSGGRRG
jgi:hypothetical protein